MPVAPPADAELTPEPRSLYGSDALAALPPGSAVYLAESFTEVDAGQRAGLTVVSAPRGDGGEWHREFTEQLTGYDVICVRSKGYPSSYAPAKWSAIAREVARVARVRTLDLPAIDGDVVGNLSDYLRRRSAAEFEELARRDAHELPPPRDLPAVADADGAEAQAAERAARPRPMAEQAFYGLAGDVVRTIAPTTEADPVALLVNFLGYFGNCAGEKPRFQVEDTDHGLNEFIGIVGATSKARKGTADKRIRRLFRMAEPDWSDHRVKSGLSSGEGLIWAVRDPIKNAKGETEDAGEPDKRLLVVENELATMLRRIEREGSSLSPLLRDAWDRSHPLEALVSERSRAAARAGTHHISVIGHITRPELARYLNRTEAANGLGNRFMWSYVQRARLLPRGAKPPRLNELVGRLHAALEFAKPLQEPLDFDEEAGTAWEAVYGPLSDGKPGLLGAIIARGEAHVVRLAATYAVLDLSPVIRLPHLAAALAVWDYSEASARYIFGEELGDPDADEVLEALRQAPAGLTRNELREHFQRHWSAERLSRALSPLCDQGLVQVETLPGGKWRPPTRYRARPAAGADPGKGYLALALESGGGCAVSAVSAISGDLNTNGGGIYGQEGCAVSPASPTGAGLTAHLPRTYRASESGGSELADGVTALTALTAHEASQLMGGSADGGGSDLGAGEPDARTETEMPPTSAFEADQL